MYYKYFVGFIDQLKSCICKELKIQKKAIASTIDLLKNLNNHELLKTETTSQILPRWKNLGKYSDF